MDHNLWYITHLKLEKENNLYEREQLAAKLQNLKTQFRNRKIAVDEGKIYNPQHNVILIIFR